MKTFIDLYDTGLTHAQVGALIGMSKENVAKLTAQEKMRRGKTLGHVSPIWARQRWIEESAEIEDLANEMGCSAIQARRYLQAFEIVRDTGHLTRVGGKAKANKGVRVPGSRRDLARFKARAGSAEHREKLAAAKRGLTGVDANHWKGGVWISGDYAQTHHEGERAYVHRVLAEKLLGRPLTTDEQCHHVDMDRRHNDPSNLIVLASADHTRLHRAMRAFQNLDQRAWLIANDIEHEDLARYA